MTPVGLIIGGLGFALVYSAITGQPLLDTLRKTFTTPASTLGKAERRPIDVDGTDDDVTAGAGVMPTPGGFGDVFDRARESAGVGTGTGGNPCRSLPIPTNLVAIGQAGHKLRADAAASHARASTAAGGFIKVTDSFRTYDQQADCHRRKPTLCAAPGGSCHEKGVAIDIVDMKNQRIIDALTAEGWVRFDPTREPWHWSYQVRG